jgi:hypothetical protein
MEQLQKARVTTSERNIVNINYMTVATSDAQHPLMIGSTASKQHTRSPRADKGLTRTDADRARDPPEITTHMMLIKHKKNVPDFEAHPIRRLL